MNIFYWNRFRFLILKKNFIKENLAYFIFAHGFFEFHYAIALNWKKINYMRQRDGFYDFPLEKCITQLTKHFISLYFCITGGVNICIHYTVKCGCSSDMSNICCHTHHKNEWWYLHFYIEIGDYYGTFLH